MSYVTSLARPVSVPRGWTPLRRNTTYGLCVAKTLSFLMSFYFPSYFSVNDYSFDSLVSHSRTFFNFPFFSNILFGTSPPKILFSMPARGSSSSVLPHIPLPGLSFHIFSFPPAFPYPALPISCFHIWGPEPYLPVPYIVCKHEIRKGVRKAHQHRWSSLGTCRKARRAVPIISSQNGGAILALSRSSIRLVLQVLTGQWARQSRVSTNF